MISLDVLKEDSSGKAHEFIKDKVLTLDVGRNARMVAGLLRAMAI